MQDRTKRAILDAAATILAARGETASLADVADAAGIARSTLYRYFPTRDALVLALAESGAQDVRSRFRELDNESMPTREALARLTRALLAVGAKYAALVALRPKNDDTPQAELTDRLVAFFQRGIDDGTLRRDIDPEGLALMYGDLINGAITRSAAGDSDLEDASAAIVSLLIDGAGMPRGARGSSLH